MICVMRNKNYWNEINAFTWLLMFLPNKKGQGIPILKW